MRRNAIFVAVAMMLAACGVERPAVPAVPAGAEAAAALDCAPGELRQVGHGDNPSRFYATPKDALAAYVKAFYPSAIQPAAFNPSLNTSSRAQYVLSIVSKRKAIVDVERAPRGWVVRSSSECDGLMSGSYAP